MIKVHNLNAWRILVKHHKTDVTPMRYKPIHLIVMTICAHIAFASQAFAEHQDLLLKEVSVTEKYFHTSTTQPNKDEAKEELNKTAGGTTIVDMNLVREGRNANFVDTLGLAAGVFIQSRAGAEESRLSIRGSGIQRTFHGRGIKLMQDGIAVNLADGSFDFPSIDPMATDYVTVYRGANALQFGASNLGGAINFVSRTGYTAPKFEARTEAGSYGYYRLGLATGGVVGNLDYYLSASTYGQGSFRNKAQQSADRLTGNVGYKINENAETRFYFGYIDSDSQLPTGLTRAELRDNPKQSFVILGQGVNRRDVDLGRIANKTTFIFDNTKIELGGFYSKKSLFHPIFDPFGSSPFADTLGVIDQETDDYGLYARLSHQGHLFGLGNEFIAGFSPTYGTVDARNYRNFNGRRGPLVNRFDQTAINYEVFFENHLNLTQDLTLVTGLQYAHSKRKSDDKFISVFSGDQSVNETYSQVNPKLGVLYALQPNVQIFANVSRSFEPPSFGELNVAMANKLEAQEGTTFEIGTRGNSLYIDWDIAVYYAKFNNELLMIGTPTTEISTQNADKTIHAGLEMGLTARLPLSLEWRQSLLINNFKFDNDPLLGSARLAGIPRSLLRSELVYRNNGFYIGPTIEWSPQRYSIDFAETLYADSYTLLGAKMGQKVDVNWAWFLEARNLTDKKYAATTGVINRANPALTDRAYIPGDARTIFTGVTYSY
jgi:iron complex outermembrane recepter protein